MLSTHRRTQRKKDKVSTDAQKCGQIEECEWTYGGESFGVAPGVDDLISDGRSEVLRREQRVFGQHPLDVVVVALHERPGRLDDLVVHHQIRQDLAHLLAAEPIQRSQWTGHRVCPTAAVNPAPVG